MTMHLTNRIGLDMDGVLLPTYEELVRLSDLSFGTTFGSWNSKDWPEPSMPALWRGTPDEIAAKDDLLIRSRTGIFASDPIEYAVEICRAASTHNMLHVITAGQPWQQILKLEWLKQHFPFIPSENVTFTDPFVGSHPNKSDACCDLSIDWYVEDRYDFARSIVESSPRTNVILIQRYLWSSGDPHKRIHPVKDWMQVGHIIEHLAI